MFCSARFLETSPRSAERRRCTKPGWHHSLQNSRWVRDSFWVVPHVVLCTRLARTKLAPLSFPFLGGEAHVASLPVSCVHDSSIFLCPAPPPPTLCFPPLSVLARESRLRPGWASSLPLRCLAPAHPVSTPFLLPGAGKSERSNSH